MTGPEHYQQAEQFLRQSAHAWRDGLEAQAEWLQTGAQVHATLALAAATVECASEHLDDEHRHINGNYITQGANAKDWQGVLQ